MPARIQRRRTKDWKLPDGVIYVGRPTRWGNPFLAQRWGLERSVAVYADIVRGIWNPTQFKELDDDDYASAYRLYSDWRKGFGTHPLEAARSELRGHDLCCWCRPGELCHADVLIAAAN